MYSSFIEIESRQISEAGRAVSGDVFLTERRDDKRAVVVSDGAGSGIRTNVVASTVASMALNYALSKENPIRTAKSIIDTFARGAQSHDVLQATFTVLLIDRGQRVSIMEFENPRVVITRENKVIEIERTPFTFETAAGTEVTVYLTAFDAQVEDRIVIFTDGVTLSGTNSQRMPEGWKRKGVVEAIENTLSQNPYISASELSKMIVVKSEMNDFFVSKNDALCASIYFRKPRKILICTGPPFNSEKDSQLAHEVRNYDGNVIISGGTTSQIIARETSREVRVIMKRDPSGLPPMSKMEGILMVTEGVLTLAKVKSLLENVKNSDIRQKGIDATYARYLLEHDHIEFLVGTRINSVHQDPNLPVELELRRTVIKDIGRILESRFMKKVVVRYI
ncbi:MAG: SpoIIE family protein phosphatase [Rikenellaceae bacterium]